MTETILPPDANRTETHLISKGSAPQVSPDGSVQLLTRRRGSRELFPSSWLRTNAEVRHTAVPEEQAAKLMDVQTKGSA